MHTAIAAAALPRGAIRLHYGSTIATNALLERRGAQVVLLTTAGFEDVLAIGRQDRPQLYALEPTRRPPLVPARRRFGVAERMLFTGEVATPLTRAMIAAARRQVEQRGVEAVAICLLHSYANPQHEQRLARALRGLGVHVTVSSSLLREYREYERTATTVVNAYVGPPMARHLRGLVRGVRGDVHVMQSNGGLVGAPTAAQEAVRTVLSGPAGGIIGARVAAKRAGFTQLITFDMGGTSTDTSVIDGVPTLRTETTIDELPVRVPALDIHTVGAGGGSLARLDAGGALQVGPESAGADPGPACYGRGRLPTVTDAHLVLGRLVEDQFLGGSFRLDPSRARAAIAPLAKSLRWSIEATAEGIITVATATMERAVRLITVERGYDPRDFTLVSFGGAGGLHAVALAEALGMSRVFVPRHPGLLSAFGMLAAAVVRDFSATWRAVDPTTRALAAQLGALERRARTACRSEGLARVTLHRTLDLRYAGQSYELSVPFTARWREAFHAAHAQRFGHSDPQRPLEMVTVRVQAHGPSRLPPAERARRGRASTPIAARSVHFGRRLLTTAVHLRDDLVREQRIAGPAVICEYSATTVIPPGWAARVTATGDLVLERSRHA